MKGVLEFNLLDDGEKEAFRCAQRGDSMSWFIDSFLDYLSVCFPEGMLEKMDAKELYSSIYDMYRSKMTHAEIWDMVSEDLRDLEEEYTSIEIDDEMVEEKRHKR